MKCKLFIEVRQENSFQISLSGPIPLAHPAVLKKRVLEVCPEKGPTLAPGIQQTFKHMWELVILHRKHREHKLHKINMS